MTADRVLIAANPSAGPHDRAERIEELTRWLRDHGLRVHLMSDLSEITHAAREFHAAGRLRALVAAGGDGTLAELVNRTEPSVPVAVFPLGTANLVAGYLGCTARPAAFGRAILAGRAMKLDAGSANGRIFLFIASCGFDADVVHEVHRQRAGHISYWSYAKPILSAIRNYEYPELRVCYNSGPHDGNGQEQSFSARWLFVANLPCYAAGLPLASHASGTDGLLNVCAFDRGSFWNGLRYLSYLMVRRHHCLADCTRVAVTKMRIESDQPVYYQLDGDPGGVLPLEIEVLPRRVTVLAPPARLAGLVGAAGRGADDRGRMAS